MDSELTVVYSGSSVSAQLLRAQLEDADIQVFLNDQAISGFLEGATGMGAHGAIKVVVPTVDIEAARPIVEKFIAEDNESVEPSDG